MRMAVSRSGKELLLDCEKTKEWYGFSVRPGSPAPSHQFGHIFHFPTSSGSLAMFAAIRRDFVRRQQLGSADQYAFLIHVNVY
jgi:hypothetical protein